METGAVLSAILQDLLLQHIFEALILYRFQQHFYLRLTAVSVERLVLISYSIRTWLGLSISQSLYTSIQQP